MRIFEIEFMGKRTTAEVTGEGENVITLKIPRKGEVLHHKRPSKLEKRGYRIFMTDGRETFITGEKTA